MGTWSGDPDDAAQRFLAEHGMVPRLDGDDLVIDAGNEALLPPWPPVVNLPGICVPIPACAPDIERTVCPACGTALARREGEWRHEAGFAERRGCTWPRG